MYHPLAVPAQTKRWFEKIRRGGEVLVAKSGQVLSAPMWRSPRDERKRRRQGDARADRLGVLLTTGAFLPARRDAQAKPKP